MKLIKKQNNKKGFTLIELVIVIAILAILALILIPAMSGYIGSANTSKNQADARSLFTAASVVAAETKVGESIDAETATKAGKPDADVKVTRNTTDGTVESITYTPEKGDIIIFDGKDFK
ncbi:prepilin-type N-terminal cleavage/methylation domain-containing protein [Erysipelothrix inopinata]|uniref:prepilin-type N-terminal cleavage/methylation domain-containing protein n=1 Tax=Erysipelothrix inopinata TaxID=225084 RepID=UPI001CB6E493|nr:prepilin-type N-terminal cleavage/methylation domain-containing protein [Erysipelothrix inopinata]